MYRLITNEVHFILQLTQHSRLINATTTSADTAGPQCTARAPALGGVTELDAGVQLGPAAKKGDFEAFSGRMGLRRMLEASATLRGTFRASRYP